MKLSKVNIIIFISFMLIITSCTYDSYGHTRMGIYEATSESGFFDSLDVISFVFTDFYYDSDSVNVGSFESTPKSIKTKKCH